MNHLQGWNFKRIGLNMVQVRVRAFNAVGWSMVEPQQISCRTAERPHRPRNLACTALGTLARIFSVGCQAPRHIISNRFKSYSISREMEYRSI